MNSFKDFEDLFTKYESQLRREGFYPRNEGFLNDTLVKNIIANKNRILDMLIKLLEKLGVTKVVRDRFGKSRTVVDKNAILALPAPKRSMPQYQLALKAIQQLDTARVKYYASVIPAVFRKTIEEIKSSKSDLSQEVAVGDINKLSDEALFYSKGVMGPYKGSSSSSRSDSVIRFDTRDTEDGTIVTGKLVLGEDLLLKSRYAYKDFLEVLWKNLDKLYEEDSNAPVFRELRLNNKSSVPSGFDGLVTVIDSIDFSAIE